MDIKEKRAFEKFFEKEGISQYTQIGKRCLAMSSDHTNVIISSKTFFEEFGFDKVKNSSYSEEYLEKLLRKDADTQTRVFLYSDEMVKLIRAANVLFGKDRGIISFTDIGLSVSDNNGELFRIIMSLNDEKGDKLKDISLYNNKQISHIKSILSYLGKYKEISVRYEKNYPIIFEFPLWDYGENEDKILWVLAPYIPPEE